jgi:hypothetical protein
LWGAGRVEDTFNLIGHALKKALRLVAKQRGETVTDVGHEAGAEMVCGPSLKVVLDRDWDQVGQREEALELVVQVLQAVESWVQMLEQEEKGLAQPALDTAIAVKEQDVEADENGKPRLIKEISKDRRISIEDAEMRHGRKSRSVRVDGYKRHVLHDLDSGLIRAVGITSANAPEASVTPEISADLEQQDVKIKELHIDRGYLSSHRGSASAVRKWTSIAKPGLFGPTSTFTSKRLCWTGISNSSPVPAFVPLPFVPGGTVHFPKDTCAQCPLRAQCTTSAKGCSVSIHPDEALLLELRERQQTPEGRAKLRTRVAVEHTLAHVGRWQGRRARYRGQRKNLFDLRRCAVVHNLHVLARSQPLQAHFQEAA